MISVVGHLTVDEIEFPGKGFFTFMGGVACYASLGARLAGAEVRVYSVVSPDYPEEYLGLLRDAGVDISGVKRVEGAETTRFRLSYEGEERVLRLLSRAPTMSLEGVGGEAVYLGPVAWELELDEVEALSERHGRVALDPQGLLRVADAQGIIRLRRIDVSRVKGLWMLRLARGEAEVLTGLSDPSSACRALLDAGVGLVVLSMGGRGALVATRGGAFKVPAYRVEAVDPTGAGDVLGGAMLAEYLRSGDLEWAAAFGSAAASIAVEGYGPSPLTSADAVDEAIRRAEKVLEGVERL